METLALESRGSVAWVWLNQPRRLNTITQTTLTELRITFETLGRDDTVRAIVLAARGQVFSAGFDRRWMAGLDVGIVARELGGVRAVYDIVEECPQPVVAAIQGAAVGGGLLLVMAADLRLAAQEATFSVPEVKLGFFPPLGLIPRLERLVGLGPAKQIVLTGEPVSAAEAHRMGLVERVVPADALYDQAQALAAQLAALPPEAVRLCKAAFAAVRGPDFAAWEAEQFAACWGSPEREAAMRAFKSTEG